MISIELSGEMEKVFEPDFVDNAASAVFHHFKHDLGRESVTVAEFAEALEKALKGVTKNPVATQKRNPTVESDLTRIASECGAGCELVFFPRLREELRQLMKEEPETVRFMGLKQCVKALTGSRRWNVQCSSLKDQIISYLRECLMAEHTAHLCSLVVE